MYELKQETETTRLYRSTITGTETTTKLIYTSPEDGAKWWAFDDLLSIPFIRKKAAESLIRLHGAGILKEDIISIVGELKKHLKSNDPEKYERAYAEVLQLEQITEKTGDAVKQQLALCPIYFLADDERIDTFSATVANEKMNRWADEPDAQAFFLNWLNDGITSYLKLSETLSQTVLKATESSQTPL